MRTTLDLPDDLLRRAKIEAVERGATLRQLVIDALQREMANTERPRKRLDAQTLQRADESNARARHR